MTATLNAPVPFVSARQVPPDHVAALVAVDRWCQITGSTHADFNFLLVKQMKDSSREWSERIEYQKWFLGACGIPHIISPFLWAEESNKRYHERMRLVREKEQAEWSAKDESRKRVGALLWMGLMIISIIGGAFLSGVAFLERFGDILWKILLVIGITAGVIVLVIGFLAITEPFWKAWPVILVISVLVAWITQ